MQESWMAGFCAGNCSCCEFLGDAAVLALILPDLWLLECFPSFWMMVPEPLEGCAIDVLFVAELSIDTDALCLSALPTLQQRNASGEVWELC